MGELSKRMRRYEKPFRYSLINRMPLIIRVDGQAFHTYTKGCTPFSEYISGAFDYTIRQTVTNMQGFKVAYTQSDEISFLLTDFDTLNTNSWFDYDYHKLVAISASTVTAYFNEYIKSVHELLSCPIPTELKMLMNRKPATFSSIAINIPKEDVTNYFLERALDNKRNSISKFARMFFSHKKLYGKNQADMHEMLHEIGKNWTLDLDARFRNGIFYTINEGSHTLNNYDNILPKFEDINQLIEPHLKENENGV